MNGYYAQGNNKRAFTIVELLVVIVVIGILAAITIVSYSGISNKAVAVSLQSDLDNASKQLKMYNAEYGYYPSDLDENNCPSAPTADNRYCLKFSSGAAIAYTGGGQTFRIDESKIGQKYYITESSIPTENILSWTHLYAGSANNCAIASDKNLYCWGDNSYGSLGNNTTEGSSVPVAIDMTGALNGLTIKSAGVKNYHTCAIASDNNAYCWGPGYYGELGNNATGDSLVPVAVYKTGVLNGLTIKSITVGGSHSCVIASDNNAYCWGKGDRGQLGNASTTNSPVPVAVNKGGVLNGLTIKSIAAGYAHTCAIASDDNVYCWGDNYYREIGDNSSTHRLSPVLVNKAGVLNGLTIKSISAGYFHTCVIASDDNAYCWGMSSYGQLGNNSTDNTLVPVVVDKSGVLSGLILKSITAGHYFTCAIASDNKGYCWGYSYYGQLGNNSTATSLVPVAANQTDSLNGQALKSFAGGDHHNCVLAADNNAYCWGNNSDGNLGDGSNTNSLAPVEVLKPAR